MKSKSPVSVDTLDDAIAKALEAAALATEAAHEAEAVLTARSDAAKSMDRTARRSGLLAAVAGGSAVLILTLGGLFWLRSSADLRDAGEVQAAASIAFVERLTEMNSALDRLDRIVLSVGEENTAARVSMSALVDGLEARVTEILTQQDAAPGKDQALIELIERLRTDMVAALAETQISLTERLTASPPVPTPSPTVSTKAPATLATAPKPAGKPAPRPVPLRQDANPFRYP